jgi:hypothetical protein
MKNLNIPRIMLIFIFTLFLVFPMFDYKGENITGVTTAPVEDPFPLFETNQTLEMAFVFINFESELLDFNELENTYLLDFLWGYDIQDLEEDFDYSVDYSFYEANSSYTQEFMTFVDTIAESDAVTSKLNKTTLQQQAIDGHLRDIFDEQNGTAIPAENLEEWFHENPYELSSDYCYYVLNLSKFDTADHSKEHWFTVNEKEPDTGIQRHWWRNEWDFPLNFDAKFPYVGYGQKYRDYFFDPTAYQWYTTWYYQWNSINPGARNYAEMDLDEFLSIGGEFDEYLGQWMFDIILFQHWIPEPVYGTDISIDLVVFHNVSHLGLDESDLQWVVNETEIREAFAQLAPNSELSIRVKFVDWDEYSELNVYFNQAKYDPEDVYNGDPPIANYSYYDGFFLFSERLFKIGFRGNFFLPANLSAVNVTGYAFVLDNATLASPGIWAGGGIYTGLGGGGQILQLMELDRLYYPNRTTPRQGFTSVVIHEAGHALGYPHTFGDEICISDFIGDVMGYYPGSSRYSKVRIEAFQRQALNMRAITKTNDLLTLANEHFEDISLEDVNAIQTLQDQILELRTDHQYGDAWDKLVELEELINNYNLDEEPTYTPLPVDLINPVTVAVAVIVLLFALYEGIHFLRSRGGF